MEEEITIDLRELAHIVQKNARFIAKVTGGCIAVAGLYLLIASPVYESDSLLRIKQPKGIGSFCDPTGTRDAHRHSRGYRRVVFFLLGVLLIVVSIWGFVLKLK